jgi:hypothetical protein
VLALLEELLEQAASATSAATQPKAPTARSLNGEELINEPPQVMRMSGGVSRVGSLI